MNMNRIKKIGVIIVMIASLIAIPFMIALILSPTRTYGSIEGHYYEMGYWWQFAILLGACNCICSRVTRKRRDSVDISKNAALLSIIAVIVIVLAKSSWGIVKLLDTIGGGNANGVFLIWLPPLIAVLICYGYYRLGRFVAE